MEKAVPKTFFINDLKQELAHSINDKSCCMLAEIAGFLRFSGSIIFKQRPNISVAMRAPSFAAARHYKMLIKAYFGIDVNMMDAGMLDVEKKGIVMLELKDSDVSKQLLRETGLLKVKQGRDTVVSGIDSEIVKQKCCKKAYLRGAFLAAGSMVDPGKSYLLEFKANGLALAEDLLKLLKSAFKFSARVRKRGEHYIVYMKRFLDIRDLLAIMGATESLIKMEDVSMKKDLMNNANRLKNCDSANIDKTIAAAYNELTAINALKARGLYDGLSVPLKSAADARLSHPEASLSELAGVMDPPTKKQTLASRFRKIKQLSVSE